MVEATDQGVSCEEEKFKELLDYVNREIEPSLINDYLRQKLLISDKEKDESFKFIKKIEDFLKENDFPCQLFIFGSMASGLAFKDCRHESDIDVFVKTAFNNTEEFVHKRIWEQDIDDIRYHLKKLSLNLRKNKEQLFENTDVDFQSICHSHMRVPLLRLRVFTRGGFIDDEEVDYESTSFQCDFNINSELGCFNTKLIQFICEFEPRFLSCVILIKFWLKNLVRIKPPKGLSSYAATLMLLFYFQHKSILPPIRYFMQLSNNPKYVNGCRVDFCEDLNKIKFRTYNDDSIGKLMRNFFKFYSEFNFENWLINTYDGEILPKPLSASRIRMQVFDPLDLKHNVTYKVSYYSLIGHLKNAFKLCNKHFKNY